MKRLLCTILVLVSGFSSVFSLELSDFVFKLNFTQTLSLGENLVDKRHFLSEEIKSDWINEDQDVPVKMVNHYFEGIGIQTSDDRIIDILVTSKKYPMLNGLRVGDSEEKILKKFAGETPDLGNSDNTKTVYLYEKKLPKKDIWKQPEYLLLITVKNKVIDKIEIAYMEE